MSTLARFGHALQYGRAAPFPIWSRGDVNTFPSALGWADILFDLANQVATPEYRGPFLDALVPIVNQYAFESLVVTQAAGRSKIVPNFSFRTDIDTKLDG